MPNKCGVVDCKGNYNELNKCRVFQLPKDESERQKWIAVLPPREDYVLDPSKFYICEKHWPSDTSMVKIPGGSTRPVSPPSIFDVPTSCLPTPKPVPQPPKQEDRQLNFFLQRDKISSFVDFTPEKELNKKYNNVIMSRTSDKLTCVFMTKDFHDCEMTVIVENKPTLCFPLTLIAFKNGMRVPLGKILNKNNGLSSYSQFFEAVHAAKNHTISVHERILAAVADLERLEFEDNKKTQKLEFLAHQLKLLCEKRYSTQDYCFAVESFPHSSYESLRDYLVLPNKRKVQAIISSIDLKNVIQKSF